MITDHKKDYRSSQGPWLDVQNMQRVVRLLKIWDTLQRRSAEAGDPCYRDPQFKWQGVLSLILDTDEWKGVFVLTTDAQLSANICEQSHQDGKTTK